MKIVQINGRLPLLMIIFFSIIKSSYQTVYSCNTTATCGCATSSTTITRIVGGESATSTSWAWAVSISIAGSYLCGATILSDSWVITAAHCVSGFQASQITIYAGSTLRWAGTQNSRGSHLIVHPSYNPSTYVNDIALVRLASPLSMSDPFVSTICLPTVNSTTLSAGEWPPVNTAVSNSFSSFVFCNIDILYGSIGCCCWMG